MTTDNAIISTEQEIPWDHTIGQKSGEIKYFVNIVIPMNGGTMSMRLASSKDINEAIDTAINIQIQQRPPKVEGMR